MIRVDVAYSLILDKSNSKILMVKNKDNNFWSLPGGAVEKGETLEQGAIREVLEETGYHITISGIVAVNECKFEHKNEHVVFITFRGEILGGVERIDRPDEITEIAWVDIQTAETRMPYYVQGIQRIIDLETGVMYCDQGTKSSNL